MEPKYTRNEAETIEKAYFSITTRLGCFQWGTAEARFRASVKAFRKDSRFGWTHTRALAVRWFLFGWSDPRASAVADIRTDLHGIIIEGAAARRRERDRLARNKYAKANGHDTTPERDHYDFGPRAMRVLRAADKIREAAEDREWARIRAADAARA